MREEEFFTLCERDWMGGDGAKISQRCSRASDKLVFDVENGFRDHGEIAFEEQVVDTDDGAGERVFYWSEQDVRCAIRDGGEGRIKGRARNSGDGIAEKLNGGGFAERAAFALERDAGGFKL